MPAPSPGHPSIDEHDESVRIAIRALDDMRSGVGRSEPRALLPPISTMPHPPTTPVDSAPLSPRSPTSMGPPSASTTTTTTTTVQSSSSATPTPTATSGPAFVSRLPFVSSALRVYEQGKASSRVVKYGAEMMESGVKTFSRPVIDRLPVSVDQFDEFACRQLDKFDRYRRPSSGETMRTSLDSTSTTKSSEREYGKAKRKQTLDGSAIADDADDSQQDTQMSDTPAPSSSSPPSSLSLPLSTLSNGRTKSRSSSAVKGKGNVPAWLEANSPFVAPPPPPPDSRSSTPTPAANGAEATNGTGSGVNADADAGRDENRQVAQRSRWQAVLLEAGGLSAALSDESMRRLKYCLQWLQYATAHIDAQILILRDFTASLQNPAISGSSSSLQPPSHPSHPSHHTRRPPISGEHMRKLMDVRKDLVKTIRQVVDVVSKYAGGALPEPARGRVRGFILKLPQRWANASRAAPGGSDAGPAGAAGGAVTSGGGGEGGERERETVVAAASGGLRQRGQRRAAQRERGAGAESGGTKSTASSRAPSPSGSPRVARHGLTVVAGAPEAGVPSHVANSEENGNGNGNVASVPHSAALVAAQRILVLATESLDMMRNVTGVMKESLDRADAWVGRLRTVGIQRGESNTEDGDPPAPSSENGDRIGDGEGTELSFPSVPSSPFTPSHSLRFQQSHTHYRSRSQSQPQAPTTLTESKARRHERSDSMEDQEISFSSGSGLPSPFFSSSASSSTWGSSIPSTPGGSGYHHLQHHGQSQVQGMGMGSFGMLMDQVNGQNGQGQESVLPIQQIGRMRIDSRYSTPNVGVVELPEEEEGKGGGVKMPVEVEVEGEGEEKVVGLGLQEEDGAKKMDVDV